MYRARDIQRKKILLTFSIFLNVGLLAYFKYANFFVENINDVLTTLGFHSFEWVNVVLPIGISFYTFQTLTYSIDVYRGIRPPLSKVSDYLVYILSFPQMIAGPIVRFNTIASQIEERNETIDDRLIGFFRFIIGLSKKVLIANVMGAQADIIFDGGYSDLSSGMAWIGLLAYTFQIYFDFSGYSDMAIGLGRMMGFTFPENFDNPYTAISISDFWKKWHITLGAWMRDYLYIPLGGNRTDSNFRLYLNLCTVFLLSGLWHGASWNFVLWGAFHGFFLVMDRVFLVKSLKPLPKFPKVLLTFFIVMMGWVIFRIEKFDDAMVYYQRLFAFQFDDIVVSQKFYIILAVAFFFSWFTLSKRGRYICDYVFSIKYVNIPKSVLLFSFSVLFFIICVSFVNTSGFNPFIYFRF